MRVAATALALWALAWVRVVHTHATTPSPAREVAFEDPGGAVPTHEVRCHGAAWVDGPTIWQVCSTDDEPGVDRLTRFDLGAGRATLLAPDGFRLRTASAIARHPQGGLVVVAGQQVVHVGSDGGMRGIGTLSGYPLTACVAPDGEALEVAYGDGGRAVIERRAADGTWSRREGPAPAVVPGTEQRVDACLRVDGAWRFVWVRFPSSVGAGDPALPVTLLEGRSDEPPAQVQTLLVPFDAPLGDARRAQRLEGGVHLDHLPLDRSSAGGLPAGFAPAPLFLRDTDGTWSAAAVPAGAQPLSAEHDVVVGADGVTPVFAFDHTPRFVQVGGTWFHVRGDPEALAVLGPDLDPAAPVRQGPPVVDRSWATTLEVLPAPEGGWWLRGNLGTSFVRVGEDLARADELGFAGRLRRALVTDRAKHNAGFYRGAASVLRRAGFLWVLFAPLLLLPVAGALRERREVHVPSAVAVLWLAGALAAGPTFWKLSGVFW